MLEISYEQQQRKLLKDFCKLKEQLYVETDEEKRECIVNDIIYISQILNRYFLIYDDEFGYDILEHSNKNLFEKSNVIDKQKLRDSVYILKENYDIYNKILLSLRSVLKSLNIKTKSLNNKITELSYKDFYDMLFDITEKEFRGYLIKQVKGKSVYINNVICPKKMLFRDGSSINIATLNKRYNIVETNIKYSPITMFLIIHEVLHSYVESKYNFNTVFNMYREVIPIYGELKLMDKFISQNQFIPEIIVNWNELFDNLKHCTKKGLGDIIYKPSDKYYYIIGQLVAYYFFDIYKSDPEYGEHIVKYFCSNMNKYSPLELLNKIDLEIEELTSGEIAQSMIKKYKLDYTKLKS